MEYQLPKITKQELKSYTYNVRFSPTQDTLITKSAKVNKVKKSVVIREAIDAFFKRTED